MSRRPFAYSVLLGALVLVAFVRPFIGLGGATFGLVDLALFTFLAAGSGAVQSRHSSAVPVLVAAAFTVVSFVAYDVLNVPFGVFAVIASYTVFLVIVIRRVALDLFARGNQVTVDVICGAVAVYLMLGVIWALAFTGVEILTPGSFAFSSGEVAPDEFFWRFLGFSFATLTTLGYGNIAPTNAQADALAGLEAVVGPDLCGRGDRAPRGVTDRLFSGR